MIEYPNGGRLVQTVEELNELAALLPERIEELFLDLETTSCDDGLDALNPWHHCWVLGAALAWDDQQGAWYLPVRHRSCMDAQTNLPAARVASFLRAAAERAKRWVNHNVKYDCHVLANDPEFNIDAVMLNVELFDTVTHAKIIDSDRQFRGGYGLDALALAWLREDISPYEAELKRWLGGGKDYGVVPAVVCGEYGCQDAMTNRRLYRYEQQACPAGCDQVAAMETELTSVLVAIERSGLRVDPTRLKVREAEVIAEMLGLEVELYGLIGRTINPSSGDDVYDVLCNQFGLPVLHWTEEDEDGQPAGNPSFDKEGMRKYLAYASATDRAKRAVEVIAAYRKLATHRSLFLEQYQLLAVPHLDGTYRLHGTFNQCLRTGRMGMRKPNMQQLDKPAKELVVPDEGCSFLSADQSQIEFRVIVHYINDRNCVEAYCHDPDTDFHEWVAGLAGMKRGPAKTMNFMMGYGGGRRKAVRTMAADLEVVGGIVGRVDQMLAEGRIAAAQRQEAFEAMCVERAEAVYDTYHQTLPTLKPTSRRARMVCEERGYVFNLHGRRRHLPRDFANKAFNSLCQGEAADIQKERTVALYRALRGAPVRMVANVHDETLLEGPTEVMRDRRLQVAVAWLLEHPALPLRVPLRVSLGVSDRNWREAGTEQKKGGPSGPIHYSEEELAWLTTTSEMRLFDWLRTSQTASQCAK